MMKKLVKGKGIAHVAGIGAFARAAVSTDFIFFYPFQLNCPAENKSCVPMEAVKIPGSVFGLMTSVYIMHLKPINHLYDDNTRISPAFEMHLN